MLCVSFIADVFMILVDSKEPIKLVHDTGAEHSFVLVSVALLTCDRNGGLYSDAGDGDGPDTCVAPKCGAYCNCNLVQGLLLVCILCWQLMAVSQFWETTWVLCGPMYCLLLWSIQSHQCPESWMKVMYPGYSIFSLCCAVISKLCCDRSTLACTSN